jgi:type II secretory pathway pseudopilin PulG
MTITSPAQKGFGLVEALASMVILALMFTAVMMLNFSNHQAAVRIANRNEAMQIGHRVIDSLQAQGLAALTVGTTTITKQGDTARTSVAFRQSYRCSTIVSSITTSEGFGPVATPIARAKKIVVFVKWTKGTYTSSINLNTVVE